ncbi:MAG: lysine--tRNA ligase [Elusimicrobia bacterium]|nr:lysine--tRNA ligase [Elusimicrobiota bacterium]
MDQIRLGKLDQLKKLGIDPYPARSGRTHLAAQIRELCEPLEPTQKLDQDASVAGRITHIRWMGKACFMNFQDGSGKAQLYWRADEISNYQTVIDTIEAGDIIWAQGFPFKTKTGEPTVHVKSWKILSKALLPLPEKWHGLKDVEARYRQRYLDLASNPESTRLALARSRMVSAMRRVLDEKCFVEVETPIFHPQPGGASAAPFVSHHEALGSDLYLRIATELYLKRLIIGGIERVYEIGKCFRNEGIDTTHNPEFTMMEVYESYGDYRSMMALTQELVRAASGSVGGRDQAQSIKFEERRLPDLWHEATGAAFESIMTDPYHFDRAKLMATAERLGTAMDHKAPSHKIFDRIIDEKILPGLPGYCFLVDYPMVISPLAKGAPGEPYWVERFELFHNGAELANAFSELNDPQEQRRRMEVQAQGRLTEGDLEAAPVDEDFIEALEHGMAPTGGLGVGIDRLCMALLGIDSIREVILFPTLKPIQ